MTRKEENGRISFDDVSKLICENIGSHKEYKNELVCSISHHILTLEGKEILIDTINIPEVIISDLSETHDYYIKATDSGTRMEIDFLKDGYCIIDSLNRLLCGRYL